MANKKQVLLNIALEHFANYGYERTSTNRLIQQAGISKGMIFHYFASKKQLYAAVLDSCLQRVVLFMARETPAPSSDLFERVISNSYAKVKFYVREPLTYRLLIDAFTGPVPEEVRDVIDERRQQIAQYTSVRFEGIDTSKLRSTVVPAQAFDLVANVANILSNRFIEEHRDQPDRGLEHLDKFVDSMKPYFRMIESGICQPEDGGL